MDARRQHPAPGMWAAGAGMGMRCSIRCKDLWALNGRSGHCSPAQIAHQAGRWLGRGLGSKSRCAPGGGVLLGLPLQHLCACHACRSLPVEARAQRLSRRAGHDGGGSSGRMHAHMPRHPRLPGRAGQCGCSCGRTWPASQVNTPCMLLHVLSHVLSCMQFSTASSTACGCTAKTRCCMLAHVHRVSTVDCQ